MAKFLTIFLLSTILTLKLMSALPIESGTIEFPPQNSNETFTLDAETLVEDILAAVKSSKTMLNDVLRDEEIAAVQTTVMETYKKNLTDTYNLLDNYKCEVGSGKTCEDVSPIFVQLFTTLDNLNTTTVTDPSTEQLLLERTFKKYGAEKVREEIGSIYTRIVTVVITSVFSWIQTLFEAGN